jgi:putative drug exporter of the RND superfamily
MGKAFGEEGSTTTVVVAMENPQGLMPSARQRYAAMVSALRADSRNVPLVQDLLADPVTAAQAMSAGGKAWRAGGRSTAGESRGAGK